MSSNYDRIARFYDVDMAQNMPFDDAGFYAEQCAAAAGPVLELGCGNGRILLRLLERGIDAWGVDSSARMLAELRRKAAERGLAYHVERMDIRRLALPRRFATILCPYSLVTYITEDADLRLFMQGVRAHLVAGGRLLIDAFVPRPVESFSEFRLDYRRPFGEATLVRSKRIEALGPALNRIERRYQVVDGRGEVLEQVEVAETIRPFTPQQLRDLCTGAGLNVEAEWLDYGRGAEAQGAARFFTLSASH
jgi:SAM-dependent methyltransferase